MSRVLVIKAHCNLCNTEVRQVAVQVNSCDRCQPFIEQFLEEQQKEYNEASKQLERRMETFRQRFLATVVVPGTKHRLEAVN